ncbi:MAG: MoaD/ThiS family protein [Pararhodobacter sp.]|nr:MoaD/ThiS family protein [Pararhodobacter sp.]
MPRVKLWGSLAASIDGQSEVEVRARTLRELLDTLKQEYPALRPQLDRGVSVAIDGVIYNDDWFTPIRDDSEVVLLARLKGG